MARPGGLSIDHLFGQDDSIDPCCPIPLVVAGGVLRAAEGVGEAPLRTKPRAGLDGTVLSKLVKGSLEAFKDLINVCGRVGGREEGHVDAWNDYALVDEVEIELRLHASVLNADVALALDWTGLKHQVKEGSRVHDLRCNSFCGAVAVDRFSKS